MACPNFKNGLKNGLGVKWGILRRLVGYTNIKGIFLKIY
jgi:hypothetical protein